ncbi:MAG: hypothetical protein Q4C96_01965 [Planctomycetia bacterium]|nr:hypothetical protein [Planctomycetia bacterium]
MENDAVIQCICSRYADLMQHDGYGEMRIDIRILKRGQKEVIVSSGKQYRFVVNSPIPVTADSEEVLPEDRKS